jgi:hypothetical protein
MPTALSKTPRTPRVPALNPNEERPENCYCSAFPRGSDPCLPCYWRRLRLAEGVSPTLHIILMRDTSFSKTNVVMLRQHGGRGGRLPSGPLRSVPVKQLPREADHDRRILCK